MLTKAGGVARQGRAGLSKHEPCLISNVFILQTMQPQSVQMRERLKGEKERGRNTHSKAKKRALVPVIRMHVK